MSDLLLFLKELGFKRKLKNLHSKKEIAVFIGSRVAIIFDDVEKIYEGDEEGAMEKLNRVFKENICLKN